MIAFMLKAVRRWRVDSAVYDAVVHSSYQGASRGKRLVEPFPIAKRAFNSLSALEYGQSIKRLKSKGWIRKIDAYGWVPRFR